MPRGPKGEKRPADPLLADKKISLDSDARVSNQVTIRLDIAPQFAATRL